MHTFIHISSDTNVHTDKYIHASIYPRLLFWASRLYSFLFPTKSFGIWQGFVYGSPGYLWFDDSLKVCIRSVFSVLLDDEDDSKGMVVSWFVADTQFKRQASRQMQQDVPILNPSMRACEPWSLTSSRQMFCVRRGAMHWVSASVCLYLEHVNTIVVDNKLSLRYKSCKRIINSKLSKWQCRSFPYWLVSMTYKYGRSATPVCS